MNVKTERPRTQNRNDRQSLTREVDHGFVCGGSPLLKKELVEIFATCCQDSFVCTVLLSLDQQSDVTELIAEALAVEFFQHCLAMFG